MPLLILSCIFVTANPVAANSVTPNSVNTAIPEETWDEQLVVQRAIEANKLLQGGQLTKAEQLFNKALHHATAQQFVNLTGNIYNDLGNVASLKGESTLASKHYQSAIEIADQNNDLLLSTQANTNLAQLLLGQHDSDALLHYATAKKGLLQLHNEDSLIISLQLNRFLVHGRNIFISAELDWNNEQLQTLGEALRLARNHDSKQLEALTLGQLALLYEKNQQWGDVIKLASNATFIAQKHDFRDQQFRWQWLLARAHRVQGNQKEAMNWFQMASQSLTTARLPVTKEPVNQNTVIEEAVIKETEGDFWPQELPHNKLYLQFADQTLAIAKVTENHNLQQEMLKDAVDIVELSQAAELKDYFGEECITETQKRIAEFGELGNQTDTVLFVYPLLFNDRIELLSHHQDNFTLQTVELDSQALRKTMTSFRKQLERRRSRTYLQPAEQLYQWLVQPVLQSYSDSSIKTIVFIPHKQFIALPFAGLHDGTSFLIEKYAIALAPAIKLLDLNSADQVKGKILLSGIQQSVQGYPPLLYVPNELRAISKSFKNDILLNDQLTTAGFSQSMSEGAYSIVHLASHGEFRSRVDDSYILTYDGKLGLDQLANLVGYNHYKGSPIELLTLSACSTAVGDDRAALGLAGLTVKSGARSALASLWSVNDRTTANLMGKFYKSLAKQGNKSFALRQAQLSMLRDKRYRHPGYWAPYVLIGKWF